jgi:uncharacterized protein
MPIQEEPHVLHVSCPAGRGQVRIRAKIYSAGARPAAWMILAHGAGAGQDSSFMVSYARALAARGLTTVTFDFPYTEQGRRLPDPTGTLEGCWRSVIGAVRERAGGAARLVAGGKSMGGRIASHVATDPVVSEKLAGLVFLGYPLHPPGHPDRRRTAHWPGLHLPSLFIQGSRDSFASPDELRSDLSRFGGPSTVLIVEGGDHSFNVTRAAGRAQDLVHAEIHDAIAQWIGILETR